MEGGHRKTTPPLQQGALGFRQWSNPKRLKGVLKNQTSSETSLEFFVKCSPITFLVNLYINRLGNKGEVMMWCQYDQVLVAPDIFDFHISNIYRTIHPGNLTWDHYQQWWLGKCISFQILQILGIYVKFPPGGKGYALKKKSKKVLQQRWIFNTLYIHSRIPAQDAYLKETELAKEARPQEFWWPRSPSILT